MKIDKDIGQAIISVLNYFDVFNFPLTEKEIYAYMAYPCSEIELEAELTRLQQDGSIYKIENCYLLSSDPDKVDRKKKGYTKAQKEVKKARLVARIIMSFPFVRMVALSGSLSKGYADEQSDIDFFIVTSTNNLWTSRTLLHLLKKLTFLVNQQHSFCMNYFIADAHLEIAEKNYFTAIELNTLVPLKGEYHYQKLMAANTWILSFLPNSQVATKKLKSYSPTGVKWLLEKLLASAKLNEFFMNLTDQKWRKKWRKKGVDETEYELAFKTNLYVSKNHPANNQKVILEQYHSRNNANQ